MNTATGYSTGQKFNGTASQVNALPPDYASDSVFGRLVSLEGTARETYELVMALEERLSKVIAPAAQASNDATPRALMRSAAAEQISVIQGTLNGTNAHLRDIAQRLDV